MSPLRGLLAKHAQLNYDVWGTAKKKALKMKNWKEEKTQKKHKTALRWRGDEENRRRKKKRAGGVRV